MPKSLTLEGGQSSLQLIYSFAVRPQIFYGPSCSAHAHPYQRTKGDEDIKIADLGSVQFRTLSSTSPIISETGGMNTVEVAWSELAAEISWAFLV
jgi:hypothetical protein